MAQGAIQIARNDQVKVNSSDAAAGYLEGKVISSDGSVDIAVTSCGCELDLSVNGGVSESWVKASFDFSDFNTAAFSVDFTPIEFTNLPAGSTPTFYKLKHSESFTGGSIVTANMRIVISGNANSQTDVFRATGNEVGEVGTLSTSQTVMDQINPSDIVIRLDVTGDQCNDLTAGAVEVWIKIATLL